MGMRIKIDDQKLIDNFLENRKFQRSSGRGPMTDSWIISAHLKEISLKKFGLDIDELMVTGIHLFLKGDFVVVSGVNFSNTKTIDSLRGLSFSTLTNSGRESFKFVSIEEKFKIPFTWISDVTIPLTFFFNSVVFRVEKLKDRHPDFYEEMTNNVDLLKSLGRHVLDSGEVALDCHLMDFECDLPDTPVNLKTEIAKDFVKTISQVKA